MKKIKNYLAGVLDVIQLIPSLLKEQITANMPQWTTKEGETLQIEDMDERHIKNCINMLKANNAKKEKFIEKETSVAWLNVYRYAIRVNEEKIEQFRKELKRRGNQDQD